MGGSGLTPSIHRVAGETKSLVVCVTGAAHGLGRALAREFHARGQRLVLLDRDAAALAELAREIPGAVTMPCDLAVEADVLRVVAAMTSLDVLVHCAAITTSGTVAATPLADWEALFAVNLLGVVRLTRALLPVLAQSPRGKIVVVGSAFAWLPAPRKAPYAASKAALHSFARSLAAEVHGSPVQVVTVVPGPVATGIAQRGRAQDPAAAEREHAFLMQKGARPELVARAIVNGLARGKSRIRIGAFVRVSEWAMRLAPRLVEWAVGRWRARLPG